MHPAWRSAGEVPRRKQTDAPNAGTFDDQQCLFGCRALDVVAAGGIWRPPFGAGAWPSNDTTWLQGVKLRACLSTPCWRANLATRCVGISSPSCLRIFVLHWFGRAFFLFFTPAFWQHQAPCPNLLFRGLWDGCESDQNRNDVSRH